MFLTRRSLRSSSFLHAASRYTPYAVLLSLGLLLGGSTAWASPGDDPATASDTPATGGSLTRSLRSLASSSLISDLNRRGFYLRAGSFSEGSGPAPGIVYWQQGIAGSGVDLFASVARSIRGYELYEVRLGRVPYREGEAPARRERLEDVSPLRPAESPFFFYADVRHRRLANDGFFGLGSGSSGADRTSFALRDSSYDAVGGYRLSPRLAASMRVGLLKTDLRPGADLGRAFMGAGRRNDFLRIASELVFDGRDVPGNPHRGSFLSAGLSRYAGLSGTEGFTRVGLDARRYQPLGSERHVLATRVLATLDYGSGGSDVPFYLQETLGGSQTMRGYEGFRFRGEKIVALSAEYRFEALRSLELAAFYDGGRIFGSTNGPALLNSYGVGLRIKTARSVLFRIDAARSREGAQIHVKIGTSF